MATRIQSHQLSNGLYVSGRPDTLPKERPPTMSSIPVPYTGGDVINSGDLVKIFDIAADTSPRPSRHNSGSGPNSGQQHPITKPATSSGSMSRLSSSSSGPFSLQPTGLITSGSLTSSGEKPGPGPTRMSGRQSGQVDGSGLTSPAAAGGGKKAGYGLAVTVVGAEERFGLRVSKAAMWAFVVVAAAGLLVGVFLTVAVKKVVILVAVGAVLVPVGVVAAWSYAWRRRAVLEYVRRYPNAELRGAVDGQYVKITGVVTCGSIPLESSFQKIPRCIYVSTELHEYRGWGGKSANPRHRCFSWGCRHSEKYATDFYLSDFQTGLRALVKTGYGAKVTPFVKTTTVADVTKEKRELSPNFSQWLDDRKLSSDDRVMHLKEGYVKEGNTVSIMGVVKRHENVLMIVPPSEPISTGCHWLRCLLPMYVEGLVLTCDDDQNSDVIPV